MTKPQFSVWLFVLIAWACSLIAVWAWASRQQTTIQLLVEDKQAQMLLPYMGPLPAVPKK